MQQRLSVILMALFGLAVSTRAPATYNATVVGTVDYIQQYSTSLPPFGPETLVFTLTNQPSVPCSGSNYFIISPATTTDEQTLKNLIALVLTAKTTGAKLTVAYDSAGGYCSQGFAGVYYIGMR